VKSCLISRTKKETASASLATTSLALKTGLAFVDGGAISGPVVGAANAAANLSLQIYYLATEYKATKAVNQALVDGNLDVTLFRTYPLMGAYLMVSATFSDLIPIENFGTPGWMDYVESLKKRSFDGIYEAATGLIAESPWEIIRAAETPAEGRGDTVQHAEGRRGSRRQHQRDFQLSTPAAKKESPARGGAFGSST
jgi:hypothetical protein